MAYLLSSGLRVESDDPSEALDALARNAFGGPMTSRQYVEDLKSRAVTATGSPLTSDDPASVVAFALQHGILRRA